jgi:hypothetical protein
MVLFAASHVEPLRDEECSKVASRNCSDISISGGVAGPVDAVSRLMVTGLGFELCTEDMLKEDWVGEGRYSS